MTKAAMVWLVMASVAAPLWAGQSLGVVDKEPAGQESVAVITLDQLTQVVLNHNHVLRAAQWGMDGAKAGVKTASALLNPKVELQQVQWQPSALNRQSVRAWSIAQPLENPTVRSARIQAAESGLLVSGQQLAMAKNDLAARSEPEPTKRCCTSPRLRPRLKHWRSCSRSGNGSGSVWLRERLPGMN